VRGSRTGGETEVCRTGGLEERIEEPWTFALIEERADEVQGAD
jgi:hypothetical protein